MRNMSIDFERLTAELVRALRGSRSQPALSRRLGFKTNVVYFWESGRRHPSVTQVLELAQRSHVDLGQAFRCLYPVKAPEWLEQQSLADMDTVARFLSEARGATPLVHLAERTGFSRFALARWLSGEAEPRAWEFFAVLHHSTHRLVDFLDPFTRSKPLASLAAERERVHAARRVAERFPMSQVLLRCLEFESGNADPQGRGFAERLGVTPTQEAEMLALLEATGQIQKHEGRWRLLGMSPLNMRLHQETAHLHRAYWADVARKRAPTAQDGLCAYNVCGVSREGFKELRRLQREYLQKARALIEKSEPVERVALLQVNLVALVDDIPSTETAG
jgi:hypothetical protein